MIAYFIGTEDINFEWGGVPSVTTVPTEAGGVGNTYRTDWARCALVTGYSSLGMTGGEAFYRVPASFGISTTDSWLHFRMQQTASQIAQTSVLRFNNSDRARLWITGRAGQYPILRRQDLDDTITDLATGTLPMPQITALGRFDIHIDIAGGNFKLYINLNLSMDFTGDLTNSEYSDITGFDLGGSANNVTWSEVAWVDEDTRDILGINSIWPFGNGFAMDWTGVKDDVNEIVINENTGNWTDTIGLTQQYTVQSLPADLTDNATVAAVMLGARMATNPTDVALVVRTGGADFASTSFSTSGAIEDKRYIWQTNPNTGVGWTIADLNDINFNIGFVST